MVTAVAAPALDTGHVADRLELADPRVVLSWALTTVPRLAVTSSFGADSAALLSLVAEVDRTMPVLFLDTGFHFAATLQYRQELAATLGLTDVRDVKPKQTILQQSLRHGPALYDRDPDRCCFNRKVAPLDEALDGFDGWVTGVRRDQTLERAATPVVQSVLRNARVLVKVSPLARWTAAQIEDYLDHQGLPRHPLVAAGYRSLGCAPCTVPVSAGADARSGRWAQNDKTECGLHTMYEPKAEHV